MPYCQRLTVIVILHFVLQRITRVLHDKWLRAVRQRIDDAILTISTQVL